MAKVRVMSETFGPEVTYTEYMHRCSEVINVVTRGPAILGYADVSRVRITTCPHCLEVIEWDDVQLPSNVENFGWPD